MPGSLFDPLIKVHYVTVLSREMTPSLICLKGLKLPGTSSAKLRHIDVLCQEFRYVGQGGEWAFKGEDFGRVYLRLRVHIPVDVCFL